MPADSGVAALRAEVAHAIDVYVRPKEEKETAIPGLWLYRRTTRTACNAIT